MFEEYNPLDDKIFRIIDNQGHFIKKGYKPKLNGRQVLQYYKDMLYARTADLQIINYQRQGRIFNYPPNLGQEAIGVGLGLVMQDKDWFAPTYRDMSALLAKGVTLQELFMNFMGDEAGYLCKEANHVLPMSIPIGSQLPHGVGIAYEIKYNKKDEVVFVSLGDGGTSQGDFHEALNYAALWKVPVIFLVQNNQYAISLPVFKQTATKNIAMKSVAYGMPGIKVDGNDIFAMYEAMKYAADYARGGNGPVLFEALTYRKGPHTTSDDPGKYRNEKEEKEWEKTDPIKRARLYLEHKKLWDENKEKELTEKYRKKIDALFEEVEAYPPYELEDVFQHLYSEPPDDLMQQKAYLENFLKWKEGRK
jgi:pyruvate dehydrogenase E1 component alpha subunit